ncbi:lanthionine synthetase LanC family protein [Chitinophaga qingshengii]|uniref:Lanthionine synthetase n=1 Tax=Chitinophaga qingshengii TaxID=1569794 RepID=A0ABR7TPY4_9BACT|nr:lanthionine synthetase LanC family protein [Chitinophaga qingshengii]MBC9932043.1 hypothetical protein [Chitinophaga qingshengii]
MTAGSTLTRIYQDHLKVLANKAYDPYYAESLFKGPWGPLLYLFYYERYVDNSAPCAGSWLQTLYADLQPQPVAGYAYCNGITGPFWLLQHLYQHRFIDIDIAELSASYITAAIAESEQQLSQQNFDFLHGSAGICHLLLAYTHQEAVRSHLASFVAALLGASRMTGQGRSLPVFVLFETPVTAGVDTFSLAHGTCSLVILLSRIYQAGIARDTCRQVITECIDFMWHHQNPRQPDTPHALFPGILDGRAPYSRLSWCYGDFNVALALWRCGLALGESRWQLQSLDIMHYTLRRNTDQAAGIVDACLCHGSSGIAAFYRHFWYETGEPAFRDAALHWHNNTLQKLVFPDQPGVYGIRGWEGIDKQWEYCWDLLDGSSGVGLSLLSQTIDKPLPWDEAFLLS